MKRLQVFLVAAGCMMLALVLAQPVKATIQTQQMQISIDVSVQVVGTPVVGYVPHQAPAQAGVPSIAAALRRASPSLEHAFHAEGLRFEGDSTLVAQATPPQHSVLVQAEVTPNPKGTILVSNVPDVMMTAAPGQTVTLMPACYLTVSVNMSTAWSLEEGVATLLTDSASGATLPGTALANNTYKNSGTPQPAATPYIVYATDGSVWSGLASGTAITTYCVNLTVTVPATAADGTYTTYAVYTLFN
ncbi:MAG TPA: hypothetical protein VMG98_08800 [Verrucomicrobiae bacterium]|nr:hypothetical protein [Verrucomicrobiae bacterium]